MESQRYCDEVRSFRNVFSQYANKRIVLYGIGRYTATVLRALKKEFNFVGLMDKDPQNIGKMIDGVPVFSLKQAEHNADMIIINTSNMYWKIIYRRIKMSKIPVYYLDGNIAKDSEEEYIDKEYFKLSVSALYKKLMNYDVVSFDVFDTLVMRKIFNQSDIFELLQIDANKKWKTDIPIKEIRIRSVAMAGICEPTLEDIYEVIEKEIGLTDEQKTWLMNREIQLEEEFCAPRESMIVLCNMIKETKPVYFVTDMYLPVKTIKKILRNAGINGQINLWESSEIKVDKASGGLWEKFKKKFENKSICHVGDNIVSDYEMPQKYGIDSIRILSPVELMKNSLKTWTAQAVNLSESIYAGLLMAKSYSDPFAFHNKNGRLMINSFEDLGYFLYGGTIFTFLKWMIDRSSELKIKRLLFMARDGYWLIEDYLFLCNLLLSKNNKLQLPEAEYLPISRNLVWISQIDESDGWNNLLCYPYIGSFKSFVKRRLHFSIKNDAHADEFICIPDESDKVNKWISPYKSQIIMRLRKEKDDYLAYLNKVNINLTDAVVDLWYNGNNQYGLSHAVGKKLVGFYFNSNLNQDNVCCRKNVMLPCFQSKNDLSAKESYIMHSMPFVEAFLTAPYGMIQSVDMDGKLKCAPMMQNQKHWKQRTEMNNGVKKFIKDYIDYTTDAVMPEFVNYLWKEFEDGNIELSQNIKHSFYYDNYAIKQQELRVFE